MSNEFKSMGFSGKYIVIKTILKDIIAHGGKAEYFLMTLLDEPDNDKDTKQVANMFLSMIRREERIV